MCACEINKSKFRNRYIHVEKKNLTCITLYSKLSSCIVKKLKTLKR